MPFDALTMAAVADEVQDLACGGRIQKIIQPSAASVGLAVYHQGAQRWLVLSADSQWARACFVPGKLAKAFASPSPFVMLLRKHLEGARLVEVKNVPRERVLVLHCAGGGRTVRVIAEVMGKHSNVVLVNEEDRILGALKAVPPAHSRVRPILPGLLFQPPPPQPRDPALYPPGPRLDPVLDRDEFLALWRGVPPTTSVGDAVRGLLAGAGPFLVEQILARAGVAPAQLLGAVDTIALLQAAGSFYRLHQTRDWHPCIFRNHRHQQDFAPFAPLGVTDIVAELSISMAIDQTVGQRESHDALGVLRTAIRNEIDRARRVQERKMASLHEGLAAADEAEEVMRQGQMVLAYQHLLERGATTLIIPELDMSIPMDAALAAQDNAERIFRRYRKLRAAQRRLPPLLREAQTESDRLADLAAFVAQADSESALRELQREATPRPPPEPVKKGKPAKRRGPPRFRLDGYTAIVGRTAQENEEVTFRVARRHELWLHARQRTGAHVILQGDGTTIPDEVIVAAARLAAYFSEGRHDTAVDVDLTEARNVRKIPGGPPGRVTYQHFRTVRVTPGVAGWEPAGS